MLFSAPKEGLCFDTSKPRETTNSMKHARASCFAFPRNLSGDPIRSGDARAAAFVIEIVVISKLEARAWESCICARATVLLTITRGDNMAVLDRR